MRVALLTVLLVAALAIAVPSQADTQTAHHTHKVKKSAPPPPLPSGPQGPVPQVPLDALPAVAPQVSYADGMLTIVAPNSTLGDILRGVGKHTSADIEVPATANERVATRLGPAPPREVMAELLNGSHFNYVLLGSAENANSLVRVVLVAKTGPDNPENPPVQSANNATPPATANPPDAADAEAADEPAEEPAEQPAAEADQTTPEQPGVKTPQQMLQEMQQRQIQMQQQQQQQQQQQNNGQAPVYPPPGGVPLPQRPPQDE